MCWCDVNVCILVVSRVHFSVLCGLHHNLHRLLEELWKRNCSRLEQSKLAPGEKLPAGWAPKGGMRVGWMPNGGALLSFEVFGVCANTCENWASLNTSICVCYVTDDHLCTGPLQGIKKNMHEFFLVPIASQGSGRTGSEVTAADGKPIGRSESRGAKTAALTQVVFEKEQKKANLMRDHLQQSECVKQLQTQTLVAAAHAQGVAMAAKKLRVKAIIVMPRTTPQIKIEAVRRLGARVLLHGAAYGRIFVGVQVRKSERKQFEQVLDRINFKYSEETNNPAYQLYLGSGQD